MMYDVVVIGSGPGGYVAAIRAAQLGLKTACIEKEAALGGTCLNIGCIPSKCLLHDSEEYETVKKHVNTFRPPLEEMRARKKKVVSDFNGGIQALFQKNKVKTYHGTACFLDPHTIDIKGEKITSRFFIIATGSESAALPFLPFDEKTILSSTGALNLTTIPSTLCVIGAGVIGVELGSVYRRLGSQVTFIEYFERICPTFDETLSQKMQETLEKQGLTFHLSSQVTAAKTLSDQVQLTFLERGKTETLKAEAVLVAIGRKPYTEGLGLEQLGITLTKNKTIPIDAAFRTKHPHIFAIGDVVEGPMLAHKASEEGIAVSEFISGQKPMLNYLSIPSVIYTHPEVASVGFSEQEVRALGLKFKTSLFPFAVNSRAKCLGEETGFVKMIAEEGTHKLLGVHILGVQAGELIQEACLAIANHLSVESIAHASHAHPTLSEALKEAALMLINGKAIHR